MPSVISKRGKERYRASVTVQGQTRQKLFPDATKKSYRKAVVWENDTRKEMAEEQSRTSLESLRVGKWANEYLEDAQNRFAKSTFDEKRSVFARFFKDSWLARKCLLKALIQRSAGYI